MAQTHPPETTKGCVFGQESRRGTALAAGNSDAADAFRGDRQPLDELACAEDSAGHGERHLLSYCHGRHWQRYQ